MHARVMTGQFQPDKKSEVIEIYGDSIIPVAREQNGFKNAYLLMDPNTNKFISITIWETEEDMTACETGGYLKEQLAKAAVTFAIPPTKEHFEVSVQA